MRPGFLAKLRASSARLLAAAFLTLLFNTAAGALPLVGLTDDNRLLLFDSAQPGAVIAQRNITGLQTGESVLGIDVRPATGQLYAVGSTSRLYRLNLSTGAASPVSLGPFSPALNVSAQGGFEVGFDFDPVDGRARVVANGQSLRIDPNSGTVVAIDGPLAYAPGEPEAGRTPDVTGIAYDGVQNNIGQASLYGVDWRLDRLVRINPAGGVTTTVGRLLGVSPFVTEKVGFDVVPGDGSRLAFASLLGTDASASRLYVVDLVSGRAFLAGPLGPPGTRLRGLAALPPESNLHAVTVSNRLLLVNALIPEVVISSRQITGLKGGESVVGIDTRTRDGRLYALGSTSRFYALDPETGAAAPVRDESFAPALSGNEFGLSIHQLQDVAYAVSDTGQSFDALPDSGIVTHTNPKPFYKTGDANAGVAPKVVALAHLPGAPPDAGFSAFLYGIDSDADALVTMNFPATGELTTIGSLGLATANDFVGFDIDRTRGIAYAALSPICFEGCPAPTLLARIDLQSGRAEPLGFVGVNEPVRSLAVAHGATFQFVTAGLSVVEDCTAASLLVTRTGAANVPAEVGYATGPPTTHGLPADPRKDYTHVVGRLRFEAGEAVKAIDVPISEDAFPESPELLSVTLSNPSNFYGTGEPRVSTLTISDDGEAEGGSNPLDDSRTFVCQHYHDFLGRHPDQNGLDFWTNNIESCGQNQQCREVRRVDTSAAFFLSIELQETGFFVYRVYQAAFARAPVPIRFEEFLRDVRRVGDGVVVGAAGWELRLEQNKRAFVDDFVTRADFRALYDGVIVSNAAYVDALNANAGGSLSQAERDALVADLNAQRINRAQALRAVVEDADFRRRETNRAFVLMQYFGYLRRNPDDPPDANFDGYTFWLTKLDQFNGNYVEAEMVKAFLISVEYRQRFGQ